MSLRGAEGDVAIPRIEGKPIEKDLKIQEIATTLCATLRNDSSMGGTINENLYFWLKYIDIIGICGIVNNV